MNEVAQKETAQVKEEHMSETQSIDSFYEALLRQSETATASEPVIENIPEENIAPVSVEAEANENNGLPDGFMELMTKAKSSKIAEIEKMLLSVGFDLSAFEKMYGADRIADGKLWGKDLKDRYSVLWLYFDLFGGLEV